MKKNARKWIILDRDGTLIAEKNYLHDPGCVEVLPGVYDGLSLLASAGFRFIIVTNQSGIGRGYYTESEMKAVHKHLSSLLKTKGITIEGFYHCPHRPEEGCECRKPKTGLIKQAENYLGFTDNDIACVIGDKKLDIELAQNIGVPSVLVMTGYGAEEYKNGVRGTFNADDMKAAAEKIIAAGDENGE